MLSRLPLFNIVRSHRSKNQAFTIVELLIVIVVIASLAVLTIVSYRGVQQRAYDSSASSAVSQAKKKLELYKVANGAYPTTGNLAAAGVVDASGTTYQYTSDGSTYCTTAVSGTATFRVTDSTGPATGGCNGHTWTGGVAMTNLITNGDFSQGTTGWSIPASTSVVSGRLSSTPPGAYQGVVQAIGATVIGHKYYFAAAVEGGTNIYYGCTNRGPGGTLTTTGLQTVSMLMTTTSTSHSTWGFYNTTIPATYYVDNVILINLTTAFGAGKEPTKAQMDQILQQFPNNWFNGTVTADTRGIL